MWSCPVCHQSNDDDTWDVCWNCSSSRQATQEEVETLRAAREQKCAALVMERSPAMRKKGGNVLLRIFLFLALLAGLFGTYFKGGLDVESREMVQEEKRLLNLADLDREFLARIPSHPSKLVSGTYVLETSFPGRPLVSSGLNLIFTDGRFDLPKPSTPGRDGMNTTIVQNGNVVSWLDEGVFYEFNARWIGIIDGDQIWGRVYGWNPGEEAIGNWRLYPKPRCNPAAGH